MENLNKQKLYALILAGVGVIACILPWWKFSFGGFGGYSVNGLHELGWLSFLGFIGAGVLPFVFGDKTKGYEGQEKLYSLIAFGAGGGIALIQFLRASSFTSIGIYLAIAAGVLGVLWIMGIVKLPDNKPKV
ncbi:MAG TPA: hypothetical protein PKA77_12010 [Chitinophagaceae bacterium]|jgi:hypothetical protein|nr:hypothetical protein [Chitinophagaceae bacterium]HMU58748.1 hypothetical protein [Chitinophagaceae bacterium]